LITEFKKTDFSPEGHMRNIPIILIAAFVLVACSHNIREEFEAPSEKYNDMVAMNNMSGSVIFVADKSREAYMAGLAAAKNARIFEYRIINKKIDEPGRKARVEIEFDYYLLNSNRVKTLRYVQEWSYSEEKDFRGWKLLTPLPAFK
jgi:hypothetical protein